MVRISCVKPDHLIELVDGKTFGGATLTKKSVMGLQVTFETDIDEDDLDEEKVEKELKETFKKDEVMRALITGIEFV